MEKRRREEALEKEHKEEEACYKDDEQDDNNNGAYNTPGVTTLLSTKIQTKEDLPKRFSRMLKFNLCLKVSFW